MTIYTDEVAFRGHPMVRASHPRTIEVTTERHLTETGDCIIGVAADKGVRDLSPSLRSALRVAGSRVTFTIRVLDSEFRVAASGEPALTLESSVDMVIRKSDYVCGRTLAVRADAASSDIPRRLVDSLTRPGCSGLLRIEVEA